MFKYRALLIILFFSTTQVSFGQSRDTLISYYKYTTNLLSSNNVSTIDSADYFRIIYPLDKTNKNYPVKEFYRDGKIKFVGQYGEDTRNFKFGIGQLTGDCIYFYPSGKRQNFSHYSNGRKVGQEFLFYPTGLVNISMIYDTDVWTKPKHWEFFTAKGDKICDKGNGHWIIYDEKNRPIVEGEVKDGFFEGLWHGKTFESDSIKYTYTYKKGEVIAGVGHDKHGKNYSFKEYLEESSVKKNTFVFINKLRKNFKIPKSIDIKKKLLDTAHVSFILGKDGKFTAPEIIGNNDPQLKQALADALDKCIGETPKKYYGIPLMSKITVSLNAISQTITRQSVYYMPLRSSMGNADEPIYNQYTTTTKRLDFEEEILGFD